MNQIVMMKKYSIYVGIDTGSHTGVATWNKAEKRFELIKTMKIHQALFYVQELYSLHENNLFIRIEDARLRTWFNAKGKTREEEREKLQGVGSVKRDAKIWEDFLTDMNIPHEMVHPKNSITKLDKNTFKLYTKYQGVTSEHSRDAAMLVFNI